MNEHDCKYHASCFKHRKECSFPLPRQSVETARFEEDNDEETKST
jgi:hypothetical protein